MPSTTQRRLATALFLDIVGSTAIASDLGDHRWRDLLTRFRKLVRTELKRFGGHEEDTAGDGFFATFAHPDHAVRCAAAIISSVQGIGLEVRCGIHTGGVETIDGTLGGIAVHIASRVMSLGGPAEILVTSTVRDLMTGAPVELEDRSLHELKGVPGTWQIVAVRTVDGEPLARPLEAGEVASRIARVEPARFYRRRGPLIAVAAAAVAIAATIVIVLATSGATTTLIEIDPRSGTVVRSLQDAGFSEHIWGVLRVQGGTLWQATPTELVRRDLQSGAIQATIPLPHGLGPADVGAGSVFVATEAAGGGTEIARYDQVSGKPRGVLTVAAQPADLRFGDGALWFLAQDGSLTEIDPLRFRVVATYDTHTVHPGAVVPVAGYVWICDCEAGHVIQFDPRADQVVRTLELAQKGLVVGVDEGKGTTVWLLDPGASTLTPIDPVTGKAGRPIGVPAQITDATIADGVIWIASLGEIRRIDLSTSQPEAPIQIPDGVSAGSIAVDPESGHLWIANCGCPRP